MNPLNKTPTYHSSEFGLFLLRPHPGAPSTPSGGLLCPAKRKALGAPDSSASPDYGVFISDEGMIYPPTLQKWHISLSRLLMIHTNNARQAWKATLESVQTGLFRWVFLRPSQPCDSTHLRKLQIESEKQKTAVFLFSKSKLPHWCLKKRKHYSSFLEVYHDIGFITDNLIFSNPTASHSDR